MTAQLTALELRVHEAISSVDDPEYPGVSIVDLGLLERLEVAADGSVRIGLIPTFSGCPALAMIAHDVKVAVRSVPGVGNVELAWLATPVWTVGRIGPETRSRLGREFTVAVQVGSSTPRCPRCGTPTEMQSMFGPSRCRAVHRCPACLETVEVMRS